MIDLLSSESGLPSYDESLQGWKVFWYPHSQKSVTLTGCLRGALVTSYYSKIISVLCLETVYPFSRWPKTKHVDPWHFRQQHASNLVSKRDREMLLNTVQDLFKVEVLFYSFDIDIMKISPNPQPTMCESIPRYFSLFDWLTWAGRLLQDWCYTAGNERQSEHTCSDKSWADSWRATTEAACNWW